MADDVYKYEGEHATYRCEKYRRMEIAGIVLASMGAGLVVTGALVTASAYRAGNEGTISNYNYYNMVSGGRAMIGLGTMGMAAGIPLSIIGGVKKQRYCGGSRDYIENNRGY